MRLLPVDDEKQLVAGLCDGLEAEGFAVDVALDGLDGLGLARRNRYDADQVDLLNAGADDYLSKPFSFAVLVARLRVLLRRDVREFTDEIIRQVETEVLGRPVSG